MRSVELFCIFKVCLSGIPGAVIELHVRDDIKCFRHFRLRQPVIDSRLQDQLKHPLDVGVGDFIEGFAVSYPFHEIFPFDFHQLRVGRESDEIIPEKTAVPLGEIYTEGQRDISRAGIPPSVHGAGSVDHDQRVSSVGKIFQRVPGYIQAFPLCIIRRRQCGTDQLIGQKGSGVERCFAFLNLAQIGAVALSVIAVEGFAVFEHRLGRLF